MDVSNVSTSIPTSSLLHQSIAPSSYTPSASSSTIGAIAAPVEVLLPTPYPDTFESPFEGDWDGGEVWCDWGGYEEYDESMDFDGVWEKTNVGKRRR
jgi:hypothetical protein